MEQEKAKEGMSFLAALKDFVLGKSAKPSKYGNMGQGKAKRDAEKELEKEYAMGETEDED